MASTRSSFSPSSSTPTRWDVFLSFRGSDTRLNFTSHLYSALVGNGIETFKDKPELRSGDDISDALRQAIQESKAYIVVFSENYASSAWCLSELEEIFNCNQTMDRLVVPVFYNIKPCTVRYQTGTFKEAFEKHESRFAAEMETDENWDGRIKDWLERVKNWRKRVKVWRRTLRQVANKSAKEIDRNMSDEADIIQEIVDEILVKINPKTLDVAKYPVGLESRVKHITSLLSSVTKGIINFGLYGMGGVGKTTLAKALFNQLLGTGSFKCSCFLANVREVSGTSKGRESLQQQFINDVLKSKKIIEVHNVEEGKVLIKERICSAKVLVLIDDIDDPGQYESLVVGSFDSGSVVITTTRDQDILDTIGVKPELQYRVNELDDAESLALFTQHAFQNAEPNNTLMLLSIDILRLADGLPLALEIFGSYLYNKSEAGWKSYIEKLERVPNNRIQQKLMISLDALDDPMLKEIFLDIACFFIGWDNGRVVEIMETYYKFADHKIDILEKKCLLKVNYNAYWDKHELGMHDLLRDMGREIVRNVSPEDPGRQSRLWAFKDICDVLTKHKGTGAIKAIISHKLSYDYYGMTFRKSFETFETFITETFKRMIKLRFLCLKDVNLIGSFEQTFEDLRWFRWEDCPLKCLPSEFYPQKLVTLELPYSKMRTIWENNLVPHVFEKLKTLNMFCSQDLTTTPDFTKLPCLESLNLAGCYRLEEVHKSIGCLGRLRCLDLQGCVMLRSLPNTICNLRSLEILNVNGCHNLKALPMAIGKIESLEKIYGQKLTVSKLPDSIGSLTKLVELDLTGNKNLETLPDTICDLRSLEILNIHGCEKLERLPDQLWKLTRLRELDASDAEMLKKLPDIEPSQIALSLQVLNLSESGITALPSGFSQLSDLQKLDISDCKNLVSIPKLPPNLKTIRAHGCESLGRLPSLSHLKHLEELNLYDCSNLTEIQGLEALISIRILHLPFTRPDFKPLTKRLCQMYSEFGPEISIHTENLESGLGWITESPYWTGQSSALKSRRVNAHLQPNQSHNFMGLILCVLCDEDGYQDTFGYSVKNTTSGFIWSNRFYDYYSSCLERMVIVPKSIFSVSDDDHIIEFTVVEDFKIIGIHLLYKTETGTIEDAVKKHETSFDALVDPELRDIFLDIASFFIGWKAKEVVEILKTYYSNVDHNIHLLKTSGLLIINDCDELEMDYLLQQFGRKNACNNSPDEPGKHSRLWLSTDIRDVLKNNQGTEAIQGIILSKLHTELGGVAFWGDFHLKKDALWGESFTMEAFKSMSKLRFLYLNKVNFTGSFDQAFKELRWFHCYRCPLKCFPSDFYPQELVMLELPYSSMTAIWEPNMVPRVFGKLKNLNMANSKDLVTTPDFIKLPCLETLNLKDCISLEEVHVSIGSLGSLVSLDLYGCVKLKRLPRTICKLRALQVLTISQCNSLEFLPIKLGNIKSLTKLNAGGLTVSHLPKSIGYLPKLVELDVSNNRKIKTLPDTICNLRSLEVLNLGRCSSLEALPMAFGDIEALKELILSWVTVSKLPDSIESLSKLVELDLSHNGWLKNLPDTICNLRSLECLNIDSCRSLEALPDSIGSLTKLVVLDLRNNRMLKTLPKLPPNLKRINALNCESLERLPNLSNLKQLEGLSLANCMGLTEIQGLEELTALRMLDLTDYRGLTYIQSLEALTSIRILFLEKFNFTKRLCQIFSEFGHQISVYAWGTLNEENHFDWITESPYWIGQSSESKLNEVSAHLLPNDSHNFTGLILCFKDLHESCLAYSVENMTSGFFWSDNLDYPTDEVDRIEIKPLPMVIVPKSIFSVTDGDHIVFEAHHYVEVVGIHLLYKTEIQTI